MPRCKNGTRRNKKTGNCDPKPNPGSKRCKNGTRRNKKTGACIKRTTKRSLNRSTKQTHLTPDQINHLMDLAKEYDDELKDEETDFIKYKLQHLSFDHDYEYYYESNSRPNTLFNQAQDKVERHIRGSSVF